MRFMKGRLLLLFAVLFFLYTKGQSQNYSIIIKNGHVIDPKNKIDEIMDIAITDGKLSAIEKNIDPKNAAQVVDATGMYVVPGLIDIHTHVFWGVKKDHQYADGNLAIQPDGFTFRNGVTTIVDAGSSGWRTFPTFKAQTIDQSQTRVLAFLNIVGEGMRGGYEQDTTDMDPQISALVAKKYKKDIVGFKLAHYNGHSWLPTDRAVEAGRLAGGIPVMVDFGGSNPPLSIEELFMQHLRPGDIFTHCFAQLNSREFIVDPQTNQVKPFVWEARKRGIYFDVGYGGISFAFSQAIPAIKQGFYPNSISTDLHVGSMNGSMKDMLTTMSKFLAMGMDLKSVIDAGTWAPAREIKREELGNLSIGTDADIAILSIRKGRFGLFDYTGTKIMSDQKLECELTIRNGKIVYDLNGIADPIQPKTKTAIAEQINTSDPKWFANKGWLHGLSLKPHRSINDKEFAKQYQKNNVWWDEAFAFLKTHDLDSLPTGEYVIDPGNVIATVWEGTPKELKDINWEAHRKFNDLQYIIKGKVRMGLASITDPRSVVKLPYNDQTDIENFSVSGEKYYDAQPGTFFIFSPMDIHRPAIKLPRNDIIKKIVIKVRVP